jgi:ADP-heptose:LPS heptosyltransferase
VTEATATTETGIPTPRRALILKPCCIGDVLMATPLARAIHARWPDVALDWAVDAHSRPVLEGNPHLTELVDASGCIRGDLRLRDWLRTARTLRRRKYDTVFVPDRSPLLTLLARVSGAPTRVGLASGWRGWAHTVRAKTSPEDARHESAIYLALAAAAGIETGAGDLRPVFRPSAEDERTAAAALAQVGLALDADSELSGSSRSSAVASAAAPASSSRVRIVLHPGGGENPGTHMPSKRWPAERFGALAARLTRGDAMRDHKPADVLVVGGPGDRALAAQVVATAAGVDAGQASVAGSSAAAGRVIDLAGRLSLGATAALIATADAYVGNDSGVAHLAAAVGTPVVVLFGPTSAARYGPVPGAGVAVVADAGEIERIAVDAVVAAVCDALSTPDIPISG